MSISQLILIRDLRMDYFYVENMDTLTGIPTTCAGCEEENPRTFAGCEEENPRTFAGCEEENPRTFAGCEEELRVISTSLGRMQVLQYKNY